MCDDEWNYTQLKKLTEGHTDLGKNWAENVRFAAYKVKEMPDVLSI